MAEEEEHSPGGVEEVGVGEEDGDVVELGLGRKEEGGRGGEVVAGSLDGERGGWTGLAGFDQEKVNGIVLSVGARCFARYVRLGGWLDGLI